MSNTEPLNNISIKFKICHFLLKYLTTKKNINKALNFHFSQN